DSSRLFCATCLRRLQRRQIASRMVLRPRSPGSSGDSLLSLFRGLGRGPRDVDLFAVCAHARRYSRQRSASDGLLFELQTVGGTAMNSLIETPELRKVPDVDAQPKLNGHWPDPLE